MDETSGTSSQASSRPSMDELSLVIEDAHSFHKDNRVASGVANSSRSMQYIFFTNVKSYNFYNKAAFSNIEIQEPICTLLMVPMDHFQKMMLSTEPVSGPSSCSQYSTDCPQEGMVDLVLGMQTGLNSVKFPHYCSRIAVVFGFIPVLRHMDRCKAIISFVDDKSFWVVPIHALLFPMQPIDYQDYCANNLDLYTAFLMQLNNVGCGKLLLKDYPVREQRNAAKKAGDKIFWDSPSSSKTKKRKSAVDNQHEEEQRDDFRLKARNIKNDAAIPKFAAALNTMQNQLAEVQKQLAANTSKLAKAYKRIEELEKSVKSSSDKNVVQKPRKDSKVKTETRDPTPAEKQVDTVDALASTAAANPTSIAALANPSSMAFLANQFQQAALQLAQQQSIQNLQLSAPIMQNPLLSQFQQNPFAQMQSMPQVNPFASMLNFFKTG